MFISSYVELKKDSDPLSGFSISISMRLLHFVVFLPICSISVYGLMHLVHRHRSSLNPPILYFKVTLSYFSLVELWLWSILPGAYLKLSSAWWKAVHSQHIHCVLLVEHCSKLVYCLAMSGVPLEKPWTRYLFVRWTSDVSLQIWAGFVCWTSELQNTFFSWFHQTGGITCSKASFTLCCWTEDNKRKTAHCYITFISKPI